MGSLLAQAHRGELKNNPRNFGLGQRGPNQAFLDFMNRGIAPPEPEEDARDIMDGINMGKPYVSEGGTSGPLRTRLPAQRGGAGLPSGRSLNIGSRVPQKGLGG